ncbi:MAG: ribosome-associated translation inhibitor RaiA [Pyrinomonadaceae bacterium]
MQFEYTGRHIEVTPAIRMHVEDHFTKLDQIFGDSSTARAHIVIEVNKTRHIAEIILHWRDHTMTATDTNADMYQALTRVIGKIEKQAVKLKKKIIERKQGATPLSALTPDEPAPKGRRAAATVEADNSTPPDQPRIVNARSYRVKPMTPEEASMSLAEDDNQFVVFRDSDTDRLSVLYKRKDGNFGLIQP